LIEPGRRVIGDAAQHVGEPGLWIDVFELGVSINDDSLPPSNWCGALPPMDHCYI